MHSIILTVHNKDWLIERVIEGIYKYTTEPYELIVVIDGCTDNSEKIIWDYLSGTPAKSK
jgi:glycosyltransferase involved in cell wall biosynthesis